MNNTPLPWCVAYTTDMVWLLDGNNNTIFSMLETDEALEALDLIVKAVNNHQKLVDVLMRISVAAGAKNGAEYCELLADETLESLGELP